MQAYALRDHDTREPIEPRSSLRAACTGTPVILEGALGSFGLLSAITDLFVDDVATHLSRDQAAYLRDQGLHRMHDVVEAPRVADLLMRLDRRMASFAVPLGRAVVQATSADCPHYFICARTWVRVQIPLRLVEPHANLMAAGHLEGHLRPVASHRDYVFTHPRHALSIWCAVGPVSAGNTIALQCDDGREPITPALAPGDLLMFDADHLHASVPNRTDETRVAIGVRIKIGRWLQYGPGTHWRPWYDESLLDTPLAPLATLQSRLTPAALRRWRWRRRWNREQRHATGDPARAAPSHLAGR
jgi:hypothetical protein